MRNERRERSRTGFRMVGALIVASAAVGCSSGGGGPGDPTENVGTTSSASTGQNYWPMVPGNCIDFNVWHAASMSWNTTTHVVTINTPYSSWTYEGGQRVCYSNQSMNCVGTTIYSEDHYSMPGYGWQTSVYNSWSYDEQGLANLGESGDNSVNTSYDYTYTGNYIGKIPANWGGNGAALYGATNWWNHYGYCSGSPQGVEYWTLWENSTGSHSPASLVTFPDSWKTSLDEGQGLSGNHCSYIFANGKGKVAEWCNANGQIYIASSYPTSASPGYNQGPFWATYP